MNNNNIHAKWELQRSTQFSNRTSVKEAGVQIFVIEHYRDDEDSRFYTEKSIASLPDIMRENEELKKLAASFYMDICRAYNAGKENIMMCIQEYADNGERTAFKSSHDYFVSEFPAFKTNVP